MGERLLPVHVAVVVPAIFPSQNTQMTMAWKAIGRYNNSKKSVGYLRIFGSRSQTLEK